MSKIKPLARNTDIVLQEFGNEILIYDLRTNKAFSLNETSAMIWQACNGNESVSEIAENLAKKFKSPISEDFVWLALEQLKKDNLLENFAEVSTDFGGLSRREVIRKVGLSTLVALPLISSLVAPMAIHAQSGTACSQAFAPPSLPSAYNPQKSATCSGGVGCACSPGTALGNPSPPSNCGTGLKCYSGVPIGWAEQTPPVAAEVPASGLGSACCP